MTATSCMKRLWLVALSLLAVPSVAEATDWIAYGSGLTFTRQDRLESIRSAFSPFQTTRGMALHPMSDCYMDLELPSMLALTMKPDYFIGTGWHWTLSNDQAIRQFQFNPWEHTGWVTLADVQPPLITTEYHKVVIRMLWTYGAWKRVADARLLEFLDGPGDAEFFSVIEWKLSRSER